MRYPEGLHKPERGGEVDWHVWCNTGAQEILRTEEYAEKISANPAYKWVVSFANASAARIFPGHPMWELLTSIAKTYKVEVFQLTLEGGYVPWHGGSGDLREFDGIKISALG